MKKYYELGYRTASLEKTSSGYFKTVVVDNGTEFENLFSTEVAALRELISYCEIDAPDEDE